MKVISIISFLLSFIPTTSFKVACAQSGIHSVPLPEKGAVNHNLTITYSLRIEGNKKTGIEEVYNGGNKTIFISNNHLRVRLVSLMRIESMFFTSSGDTSQSAVTIVKESGKDKFKTRIYINDWKKINSKYDGVKYNFTEDTATVLSYSCKKVIVKLKNNKEIIAWYTVKFYNPLLVNADPAFAGIPGAVLMYQYKQKAKSLTYTATEININTVHSNIFIIPTVANKVNNLRP